MKRYLFLMIAAALAGCQTTQKPFSRISLDESQKHPKEETHLIVLHKDSVLDIKTDGFNRTYFNIVPGAGKTVVHYTFDKGREADLPDSGYHEAIHFEIDNEKPEVELSGRDLAKANVMFGRWCFCPKGTVGNFRVYDGKLSIVKEGNKRRVKLTFSVPEIPQIIKEVNAVIE